MIEEIKFILESGLEGSAVVLISVIAYKIYKMKIHSSSKCCGDAIEIETENPGGENNV